MNPLYAIEEVVPHRQDMCLLQRILRWDQDSIEAELVVPPTGLFIEDGEMPAWIGIEYMAQAIAAWAGCRARAAGSAPQLGFLLGSRRYSSQRSGFPSGSRLRVQARRELLGDNGLGLFACRILAGEEEWAVANVSVYEPADAKAYLESGQA
ncbi:hotdog family protein [Stenotrophomonas maltophilia]|uniref:hotdog family protein n=1 Tax=Stenotrophomonas maltophilia TaxID=40324 RepID=UPI002096A28B|nr:hotdog family protein [Stenotrophomonas maltophilia]MCO7461976.1 hotdog family protein [Stenotrophomonas maltophilia]HEL4235112.1 hotdog family protein [Stenotrophomonas maltophilia]